MGPHVPSDLIEFIKGLEKEAFELILKGQYYLALKTYELIYEVLDERQNERGERIHLGAPLHMMGLSCLLLGNINNSFKYFLLAYITDTINAPIDDVNQADGSPAYNAVTNLFKINTDVINQIKILSRHYEKNSPFNPSLLLDDLFKSRNITYDNIEQLYNHMPSQDEINNIKSQFLQTIYVTESGQIVLNQAKDLYAKMIIRRAAEIALQNGRDKITDDDIKKSLKEYSDSKKRFLY